MRLVHHLKLEEIQLIVIYLVIVQMYKLLHSPHHPLVVVFSCPISFTVQVQEVSMLL